MKAIMKLTPEMLVEALHLPKDTVIINAYIDWRNPSYPEIILVVSHPDIKEKEVLPYRSYSDDLNP